MRTVTRGFWKAYSALLNLEERLTIAMAMLLNLLMMLFAGLSLTADIFTINLLILAFILIVSTAHKHYQFAWLRYFRDWYVLGIIIIIYMENRKLIPLVNPHDVDSIVILIDRFLFHGHDPTVLLERITFPLLTEVLQIAYASFYFLPLTLCLLLYFKRSPLDFHINASTILMGFYLSYIGYYLLPAIGPRFTLNHLQSFPLTGVLIFNFLRNSLNIAEGMMRDCCPSGHALVSLLAILLARRYHRAFFPAATLWGALIISSTVYLRYHYVTDIIEGVILGLIVYAYGPSLSMSLICGRDSTGMSTLPGEGKRAVSG
jgi:membrane-associated phospholipid phosphatase